jgi:hypothetical protein
MESFEIFGAEINPSMRLVVDLAPRGTSLCETASFRAIMRQIGPPVRPVDEIKKFHKKLENTKSANSAYWRGETPWAIVMSFVLS